MELIPLLVGQKKKARFSYRVQVADGEATTPKFTLGAGAPAAVVDWGDGSSQSAVTSGSELTHTYTTGGTYTVRLIMSSQAKYLTQIDLNTDKAIQLNGLRRLTSLVTLRTNANTKALPMLITDLPSSLVNLYCYDGLNSLTGDIKDLPTGMVLLYCNGGSNGISGSVSDIPQGMTTLSCGGANNSLTGGTPPNGIASLSMYNNNLSRATMDQILLGIYTNRANFTATTPTLVMTQNASPTGTYQNATPPTNGAEYTYKLINDPDGEGFKKWDISYTL